MDDKSFYNFEKLFPVLFRNCYCGCGAGEGWYDLVYELCVEIEKIAKEKGLSGENYPQVVQIKEKFGSLRFYLDYGCKEIYDAIEKSEKQSGTICEFCGKPAEVKSTFTGWLKCACDDCLRERNDKMRKSYETSLKNTIAPLQAKIIHKGWWLEPTDYFVNIKKRPCQWVLRYKELRVSFGTFYCGKTAIETRHLLNSHKMKPTRYM
jgi:hypothetical protein